MATGGRAAALAVLLRGAAAVEPAVGRGAAAVGAGLAPIWACRATAAVSEAGAR